jgi:hypothetical protein
VPSSSHWAGSHDEVISWAGTYESAATPQDKVPLDLKTISLDNGCDRMTPITTTLCKIGWNFNELPGKPLALLTATIPIHPQEAVPEALLSKGLRKPRGKRR